MNIKNIREKVKEGDKKMILLPPTFDIITMALKKQEPIEADYEGDSIDEDGNYIYDTWICPTCGEKKELRKQEYESI